MTTTSGYRFSQPQRVDSGLQQNVANTVRLGTNSPGPFGEAPRDRRNPHRTRKHLRSRLLAFYHFPELVFQLQCGSHTCRLRSSRFVIACHSNLVKRSATIANVLNEITKDACLFTFVFLRECLGRLLAVCWQVRGAQVAKNSGALSVKKSEALPRFETRFDAVAGVEHVCGSRFSWEREHSQSPSARQKVSLSAAYSVADRT